MKNGIVGKYIYICKIRMGYEDAMTYTLMVSPSVQFLTFNQNAIEHKSSDACLCTSGAADQLGLLHSNARSTCTTIAVCSIRYIR